MAAARQASPPCTCHARTRTPTRTPKAERDAEAEVHLKAQERWQRAEKAHTHPNEPPTAPQTPSVREAVVQGVRLQQFATEIQNQAQIQQLRHRRLWKGSTSRVVQVSEANPHPRPNPVTPSPSPSQAARAEEEARQREAQASKERSKGIIQWGTTAHKLRLGAMVGSVAREVCKATEQESARCRTITLHTTSHRLTDCKPLLTVPVR